MGFVRYDRTRRDVRIRELDALGHSLRAIAEMIGCHHETVYEVLNPDKQAIYNARRAAHNTSPEGLERQRKYRARKASRPPQ